MEEVLVSFGTAKLAKEKLYPQERFKYPKYSTDGYVEYHNCNDGIQVPTQSLLQKWLREKHKIHIHVRHYSDCPEQEINNENYDESLGMYGVEISEPNTCHEMDIFVKSNFYTYEEALEIGLQEALKLIP